MLLIGVALSLFCFAVVLQLQWTFDAFENIQRQAAISVKFGGVNFGSPVAWAFQTVLFLRQNLPEDLSRSALATPQVMLPIFRRSL